MQFWEEADLSRPIHELYASSEQPTAVVDQNLLIVWTNKRAREMYPFLCMPDGVQTMLRAEDAEKVVHRLAQNLSFRVVTASAPLPGCSLFFSALRDGFSLVFFEQSDSVVDAPDADAILSSYSGQIRTPLTHIFSSLNSLARNRYVREVETLNHPLMNINQSSYRLLRHCTNFSEFFRYVCAINPIHASLIDFGSHVRELCISVRTVLQDSDIAFQFSIPSQSVYCRCDWAKIETALLNLLSNACRYSSEQKRISLTLEQQHRNAVVTITDHGYGIDPDILPLVFHPFFSRDVSPAQSPGGGLGLTIAKLGIQSHGGTITLQSTPGKGTTAAFTLPVEQNPDSAPLHARSALDLTCDRFSPVHVLLSDSCRSPWE